MNKLFIVIFFCIFLKLPNIKSERFDILDEFKIFNQINENDVKFERIYDAISSNVSIIKLLDSETNENVAIEVIFRMRTPSSNFQLIQFGNEGTNSLIKINLYSNDMESILEIVIKDSTKYFVLNYNMMSKFLDGRWHKIVIKFSKAVPGAYFDCELLPIARQIDSQSHKVFTLIGTLIGTNLPITVGIVTHGSMMVDINSFKMHINKLDKLNGTYDDIKNFNNLKYENSKEINILKEFFNYSAPHTFGDKCKKKFTIRNSFVTNDLKNFTIEIIYRMNSEMSPDELKSITLLEMRDEMYNTSFLYQIGNKMIMTTEHKHQIPSTNYHGYSHNINVFDGNWHKLICFYSRNVNEFSSIWVDCKMIDLLYGSKFNGFSSVLQNVTIMNNFSETKLENFEVKTFKIHADLNTNLQKYCSEL